MVAAGSTTPRWLARTEGEGCLGGYRPPLCSKRLHPFIPELVNALRRHSESTMSAEVEAQVALLVGELAAIICVKVSDFRGVRQQ